MNDDFWIGELSTYHKPPSRGDWNGLALIVLIGFIVLCILSAMAK
jgi:hypothetical protein